MLRVYTILLTLGLISCNQITETRKPVQTNEPVVEIPSDPECHRDYQNVSLALFNTCILPGMSYEQVAIMIGNPGELQTQSGSTDIYKWGNGSNGFIFVMFTNGKVVSKSQGNLPVY